MPTFTKCFSVFLLITISQSAWSIRYAPPERALYRVQQMPYIGIVKKVVTRHKPTFLDKDPMKEYWEGCGDRHFWKVVTRKRLAIDGLINQLDNTRPSGANMVLKPYYYAAGDIAYVALREIIHDLPSIATFLNIPNEDVIEYLHADITHRKQLKKAVQQWYRQHKADLVWVKSDVILAGDCSGKHPNGGHFKLKPQSHVKPEMP